MKILQDIATAVRLTGEVRKARREGATGFRIQPVITVPLLSGGGGMSFLSCMEGCQLFNSDVPGLYEAVHTVYKGFNYEVQRRLAFAPKPGEWRARAEFWKRELKDALPENLYYKAMMLLLNRFSYYARKEAVEC